MSGIRFQVDGREVDVAPGTSVAAAMLNAGVIGFRDAVKGGPRSPLCAMGVCHECRVTIDGIAHRRSCLVDAAPGMIVETNEPRMQVSSVTASVRHVDADVAVVGAGPAGLAAAVSAAERGVSVVVLDESARSGGQIWRHGAGSQPTDAARSWMARLERTTATRLHGVTVSSVAVDGDIIDLTAEGATGSVRVHARAMVIATGARERFIPFSGSTLPNVVGVGAMQALIKSGLAIQGKRVVIAGTGPLLLPVAASVASHGASLKIVAEQASRGSVLRFAAGLWRHPAALLQAAQYRKAFLGTRYATGKWVSAARGNGKVEEVDITDGVSTHTIACDILCVSHGLIPNTEIARQVGCVIVDGAVVVDDECSTNLRNVYAAGEIIGVAGVDAAVAEGCIAGTRAAGDVDGARRHIAKVRSLRAMAQKMDRAFALRGELRAIALPDSIVCRCEDVRVGDVMPDWSIRQAKLYTRTGMGPCQGRTCAPALEFLYGSSVDGVRIPVQPVRLSTLLGERNG